MTGAVWTFGNDINTDLIVPGGLQGKSERDRALAVFSANRPGWSAQVAPGDIIVAGTNFGTGSSRPAAQSLRALGIACVLAESLNGLFFRNAVNYGFAALTVPGISTFATEGQPVDVAIGAGIVTHTATGAVLPIAPIPASLLALMTGGGIFPELERRGLIAPRR